MRSIKDHGGEQDLADPFSNIEYHGGELVLEKPPSCLKNKNGKIKTVKNKNKNVKFTFAENKKIVKTVNSADTRTHVRINARVPGANKKSKKIRKIKKLEFNKFDLLVTENVTNHNKLLDDIPDKGLKNGKI